MALYQGDHSGAFGNTFITINLKNPHQFEVSKIEFKCGCILKTFENPEFPLRINFDEEETKRLDFKNACYVKAYDNMGRPKTCKGTLIFRTKGEVV